MGENNASRHRKALDRQNGKAENAARRRNYRSRYAHAQLRRRSGLGAFEEIAPKDWTEKVYKPDILGKPNTIYKKPGYDPL
jgi:hypothetical protein